MRELGSVFAVCLTFFTDPSFLFREAFHDPMGGVGVRM